jgi:hypothetical protein
MHAQNMIGSARHLSLAARNVQEGGIQRSPEPTFAGCRMRGKAC